MEPIRFLSELHVQHGFKTARSVGWCCGACAASSSDVMP
jgi:hypothetical protein